jgi:hypothetical protein
LGYIFSETAWPNGAKLGIDGTFKSLFVGLVKTDLNWFNNNSAFPLLLLMRFVPFFSGAIPPDS